VWQSYWRLRRDPFRDGRTAYVPTPGHEEAIARLVHAIASCERLAVLRAAAGLGKSVVLERAMVESRSSQRRIARLAGATASAALWGSLASRLGVPVAASAGRSEAWRALADAVRLARWQRLQIVCAFDDCQDLSEPDDRHDLERLLHLDPHPESCLTIIQVFRSSDDDFVAAAPWQLAIRLTPLSRAETEQYLRTKLSAAGRDEPAFTPRAIHRLHAISAGVPRGLDRLAALALFAGAGRGLPIITPEVIEGVAHECTLPLSAEC
jgi:type II secretory pathway predicted ATPase ExeA